MALTIAPTPLRVRRLATKPILRTLMFLSSLEKVKPLDRLVLTMSPSRTSTCRSLSRSSCSTISEMVVFPDPESPVNHKVNPRSSFIYVPFDSSIVLLVYSSQGFGSHDDRGIVGGEPIRVVELGAFWRGYVPVEERVFRLDHPRLEPPAQLLARGLMGRVCGEVVGLVGIHDQVVELLGGDLPLAPAVRE